METDANSSGSAPGAAPGGSPATPPPLPPPLLTPPPVIKPPAAAPARKSYGWMIVAIILMILLVFSIFGIGVLSFTRALPFRSGLRSETFGSARDAGPKLDEFVLANNRAPNKIVVISVDGIITSRGADPAGNNMVDIIQAQLDRAAADRRVRAVILKVDSPGGEVLASDEIYRALRAFQSDDSSGPGRASRRGKPVICSMGSLAASGGYYISAGSRWIVANDLTLTGSIGVIMHGWNYRGLMDKVGVMPVTYKSGKFKDMLSGDRATNEIPAEERAMVQGLIDETFQQFKDVVADGRGNAHNLNQANKNDEDKGKALVKDWKDYADGRVMSGRQALNIGLVDELGNFDDAVDRAMKIADIRSANLVEYRVRYDLANFLSLFGQNNQTHDIKLDLGVDAPKLRVGLPYYLYQP